MSLVDEYRQQFVWRAWPQILVALPLAPGQRVLDVGCGPGDLAGVLARRGCRVVGIDANEELLAAARARAIPGAEFRQGDLRSLAAGDAPFDGLWCSFAAAYFPDFAPVLATWAQLVAPGAWVALVEIDDLFAHEPLPADVRDRLAAYADEALRAGRYDFRMGGKLAAHAAAAGLEVVREFPVPDREFAFAGPADSAVLDAWRNRFDRMRLLQERCGAGFAALRGAFLAALQDPAHRSLATVRCCIARRRPPS
jgi:SAM-dependent methyltransferase